MALDLQLPLDSGWGYVSSEFGPRTPVKLPGGGYSSSFHKGTDFGRAGGTPIYAAADGVVVVAGWNGAYGNQVAIRHQESGPRLSTSYSHMQNGTIAVSVGNRVRKGQLIGRVGTTGSSNGNHLHYECLVDGQQVNPRHFHATYGGGGASQLTTTQRKVVAGTTANRRIGAPKISAPMGEALAGGTVGNFKGWVNGDVVQGNGVWFVGISGDFFWSGGFEGGANVAGLTDLNAAQAMLPNQRRTTTDLNGRSEPLMAAPVVQNLPVNTVADFDGWRHGDSVSGETRWVRGAHNKNWFSLLYLEPRNVDGLADLNGTTSPPEPNPRTEADATPNLVSPTAADFPSWIRFDTVLDPDGQKPTINIDTERYYDNTPYNPIESHAHWWNEPGKGGTHDGNVNYIKNTKDLSVNFVLSAGRVTLMVPINKNALTTGKRNPFAWKIENDPMITTGTDNDLGYKTLGYLHYIVEKLNPSLLNNPIRLHKEFYDTSCSNINTAKVREYAEKFRTGALDPATGNPPVVNPDPDPDPEVLTVEIKKDFYERVLKNLPSEFRSLADDIDEGLA